MKISWCLTKTVWQQKSETISMIFAWSWFGEHDPPPSLHSLSQEVPWIDFDFKGLISTAQKTEKAILKCLLGQPQTWTTFFLSWLNAKEAVKTRHFPPFFQCLFCRWRDKTSTHKIVCLNSGAVKDLSDVCDLQMTICAISRSSPSSLCSFREEVQSRQSHRIVLSTCHYHSEENAIPRLHR